MAERRSLEMSARGSWKFWLMVGLLGSAGCGGSSETTHEAAEASEETPAAEEPAIEPETRQVWDDPTYRLAASAETTYTPGTEGHFEIVLEPKGDYHVNQDYPLHVGLTGPQGIAFPQDELGIEDAAEFGEPRARFQVAFVPETEGEHEVTAQVHFAVCTPDACMPERRTLALALPVRGGEAESEQAGPTE